MTPLDRHDLVMLHILNNNDLLLSALKVTKSGIELFPPQQRPHLALMWRCLVEAVVKSKRENRWLQINRKDFVASVIEKVKTAEIHPDNKARIKEICVEYLQEVPFDSEQGRKYLQTEVDEGLQRNLSRAIYQSSSFEAVKQLVEKGESIKQGLSTTTKQLFVNPLLDVRKYLQKVPKTPMGVQYFDKMTCGGMSEGEICLSAAGTGQGKSMMTVQFVGTQLMLGNCVAWFTYEQPFDQDLMQRMVSFITGYELDFIRTADYDSLAPEIRDKFNVIAQQTADKLIAADFSNRNMLDDSDPDDDFSAYSIRKRLELWEKQGKLPTYVIVDWLGAAVKNIATERNVDISNAMSYIALANVFISDLVQIAKDFKTRIIVFHQLKPEFKKSPPSRKPTSSEIQFITSANNWFDYCIVQGIRDQNQRCWYICDKNRKAYPSECVIELDGPHAKFKLLNGYAPGRDGQFINISELAQELDNEPVNSPSVF